MAKFVGKITLLILVLSVHLTAMAWQCPESFRAVYKFDSYFRRLSKVDIIELYYERIQKAKKVLNREITKWEAAAIHMAHYIGEGELGKDGKTLAREKNWKLKHIKKKYLILKDAGFSDLEIRKLMDQGIVGFLENFANSITDYNRGTLDSMSDILSGRGDLHDILRVTEGISAMTGDVDGALQTRTTSEILSGDFVGALRSELVRGVFNELTSSSEPDATPVKTQVGETGSTQQSYSPSEQMKSEIQNGFNNLKSEIDVVAKIQNIMTDKNHDVKKWELAQALPLVFFAQPESAKYPMALRAFIEKADYRMLNQLFKTSLHRSHWVYHKDLLVLAAAKLSELSSLDTVLFTVLALSDEALKNDKLVDMVFEAMQRGYSFHQFVSIVFKRLTPERAKELTLRIIANEDPQIREEALAALQNDNLKNDTALLNLAINSLPPTVVAKSNYINLQEHKRAVEDTLEENNFEPARKTFEQANAEINLKISELLKLPQPIKKKVASEVAWSINDQLRVMDKVISDMEYFGKTSPANELGKKRGEIQKKLRNIEIKIVNMIGWTSTVKLFKRDLFFSPFDY